MRRLHRSAVAVPRTSPPGEHVVKAHYRGTRVFTPATAKPRTLSVTRG